MKSRSLIAALTASLTLLAACGGGGSDSDSDSDNGVSETPITPSSFYTWDGNYNGKSLHDFNDESFYVTTTNGCLYSVAHNVEIVDYCRTPGSTNVRMRFVDYWVVPATYPGTNNTCILVLVEESTRRLIDIFRRADGLFQYVITNDTDRPC